MDSKHCGLWERKREFLLELLVGKVVEGLLR